MGGGISMLLVGFLAGGVVASVVWAFAVSGRRRAVEAQKAERERIMTSVGETLAEADAIETNFRSGALAPEAFRRSLGDRINAVMRLLRTNMHLLDAFFVKYAEQEAREYMRVIDNPERRKHEGPEFPPPPIPGAVDKSAMYEQPFAAPAPEPAAVDTDRYELPRTAPSPIAASDTDYDIEPPSAVLEPEPEAIDTDDRYEPPPAPAPIADAGTDDDFEPQTSEPEPSVTDTDDQYEPTPPAPAPIADAADTDDDFEPHAAAPEPSAVDTDDQYEPTPSAPAPIAADTDDDFEPPFAPPAPDAADTAEPPPAPAPSAIDDVDDDFEPPHVSATETATLYKAPQSAPVREEELVLGESPEDMGATFDHAPAAHAPVFAPPPPPPIPAADSEWSGGDSIEEFEAAFEQFEPAAPQTPQDRHTSDHEFTETSSIDRGAIQNAMAAAGQAPQTQTPLPVQILPSVHTPSENEVEVPLDKVAQHIEQEARKEKQEQQGITGDDVVDSIDNFFNLK